MTLPGGSNLLRRALFILVRGDGHYRPTQATASAAATTPAAATLSAAAAASHESATVDFGRTSTTATTTPAAAAASARLPGRPLPATSLTQRQALFTLRAQLRGLCTLRLFTLGVNVTRRSHLYVVVVVVVVLV